MPHHPNLILIFSICTQCFTWVSRGNARKDTVSGVKKSFLRNLLIHIVVMRAVGTISERTPNLPLWTVRSTQRNRQIRSIRSIIPKGYVLACRWHYLGKDSELVRLNTYKNQ